MKISNEKRELLEELALIKTHIEMKLEEAEEIMDELNGLGVTADELEFYGVENM